MSHEPSMYFSFDIKFAIISVLNVLAGNVTYNKHAIFYIY